MSEITKPIALDESLHTTEQTPRNLADVLSDELQNLATAIGGGSDKANKTDIATVEPTNTASRAYSVGELVYVNGNLYKVITAITSGATFTVGTNIQSTNVSGTVKDALDKIGVSWTLDFGTYNNGSYRSKVARVGNIIFFYFSGAKNLTVNTFVQVGTLPSACPKPSSTQTVNVQFSSAYAQVAIYANGSIQVNCNEVNCYANGMMMFTI